MGEARVVLPAKREGQQVAFVLVEKVWWKNRARKDLGDMEGLTGSVQDKGIITPITITPDYELLSGERRITAAKAAGLTHIPALIRNREDTVNAKEIELIENLCRKDFTYSERASLVAELDAECRAHNNDWSGRKTAQLLNRSKTDVARELELAKAIQIMPELGEQKDAADALKMLAKMKEQVILDELSKRQQDGIAHGSLDRGIAAMLDRANANYQIGDVFKGLATLRTNGVVHVIECDPPYGIDLNEQKASKESVTSTVHKYDEIERDAYPAFLERLTKELYRVAGPDSWLIFWFGPTWQQQVLDSLRKAQWQVDEIPCIWVKQQGQTMQPELYLARSYEPFYLCRKGKPILLKRGRRNVFDYPGVAGNLKYHPTQRPVELIQDILETTGAFPNAVVLCPFLGSGATIRAAYNIGCKVFGWDISDEYKQKLMLLIEEDARRLTEQENDDEDEEC